MKIEPQEHGLSERTVGNDDKGYALFAKRAWTRSALQARTEN